MAKGEGLANAPIATSDLRRFLVRHGYTVEGIRGGERMVRAGRTTIHLRSGMRSTPKNLLKVVGRECGLPKLSDLMAAIRVAK